MPDKIMPDKKPTKFDDLAHGKRVLNEEAHALSMLAKSLDEAFVRAVEAIDAMKQNAGRGRLIVAGIGKSGHIARKLSASFASTGTPSHFVHPGEASHGDLGMITKNDVVIMLSNSGETSELSDLIHYTRRFEITSIAMTSRAQSTLAKHCDILLCLPPLPEACPNNLAPTTSTTMMMALGDALAVALLERMGLTEEQFKVYHPGGKLGQRLQKVSDLMHKFGDLPLIKASETMDQAILILSEKNMGSVIVLDDAGAVCGIVTDGDLKRHMAADLLQKPVSEVMSGKPMAIAPNALGVEAMNIMTKTPGRYITSLVVMENEELVGMIRLQDCLQAGLA